MFGHGSLFVGNMISLQKGFSHREEAKATKILRKSQEPEEFFGISFVFLRDR
jgi:hypothetical protein